MYRSDPFAYDFEAALTESLERKRTYERKKQAAQEASEQAHLVACLENQFHPANHGGITYGLGYPSEYTGEGIELTANQRATHRRKAAKQGLVRRAVPPTRRVGTTKDARASGLND